MSHEEGQNLVRQPEKKGWSPFRSVACLENQNENPERGATFIKSCQRGKTPNILPLPCWGFGFPLARAKS